MTDSELNNHLHSDIERIIVKWRPTLSLIRLWNKYTDDYLTEILSKYCEWWEITKPNYDGLGESLDNICKVLMKEKSNIDDYQTIKLIFGESFAKVYDLQQFRDNQIQRLYETDRR